MIKARRKAASPNSPPIEFAMRALFRSAVLVVAISAFSFFTSAAAAQTVTVGATSYYDVVGSPFFLNSGSQGIREGRLGQVFRTPNHTAPFLSSWTIWTEFFFSSPSIQLSIFDWNGVIPVGPALFTSAPMALGPEVSPLTFDVGQMLNPTSVYLAVLSAVGPVPATPGDASIAHVFYTCNAACSAPDEYPDGGLVSIQSSFDSTTGMWRNIADQPSVFDEGNNNDMKFQAVFGAPGVTATPEPAGIVLVATGLIGVAGLARRRRMADATDA
jgi:hypothetical protein